MSRYRGASCRLCRREGTKLFLKGTRCDTEKCTFNKRAFSPGQHGKMRTKLSDYAVQLREKQKVKRIYGLSEHQFRLYFQKADRSEDVTGTVLLQLLERRLDSVIYTLGFATSRAQARQMVKHNFVLVNSRPVNIPSFLVKANDLVSVRSDEKKAKLVRELVKIAKEKSIPDWLMVDQDKLEAKIVRFPKRDEIHFPIREQLIVELYSK